MKQSSLTDKERGENPPEQAIQRQSLTTSYKWTGDQPLFEWQPWKTSEDQMCPGFITGHDTNAERADYMERGM